MRTRWADNPTARGSVAFRRRRRSCAARPGVIIVIALFSTLLVAGVFSYLINMGRHAARRVLTQHNADAAAQNAAGWTARQFNTVAVNNVAMTRLIALVPVLDALPKATQFAWEDQTAFRDGVDDQLARGVGGDWFLSDSLRKIRDEFQEEIDILEPMHDYFNGGGYDITQLTHYNGGSGQIWQALTALDHYNQATMANVGVLAQTNAIRGTDENLQRGDEDGAAFVVPAVLDVPWERGVFDDFQRPVREGLLPNRFGQQNVMVDDKVFNRGPWDTIYGWRDLVGGKRNGYFIPGQTSVAKGGKGSVPIGRGAGGGGGGGRFVTTSREPDKYRVYSEYTRMLRRTGHFSNDHLHHSRFGSYANTFSNYKLGYAWPGTNIKQFVDPEWVLGLEEAVKYADNASKKSMIVETAFIGSELKSKYPMGHPMFLKPGTYAVSTRRASSGNPFLVRVKGWLDPRPWEDFPTVTKIADHIWRDVWSYEVNYDKQIGITGSKDGSGKWVPQKVYRVDDFVFIGINVGTEVDIENPFEGLDKRGKAGPAPTDLDHTKVERTELARRQYLTFLGVARRAEDPLLWPQRFHGDKPDAGTHDEYGNMVAIAQAHVFNNHSWDLWTQMWHAQLQPVSDYRDWMNRMAATAGDTGLVSALVAGEYDQLLQYLVAVEPLAEPTLKH